MKFNFRKIASVIASAVMLGSTMGIAAAANYPSPFVVGGTADAAVVVTSGTHAGAVHDWAAAVDVEAALDALVTTTAAATASEVTGGDSVLIGKSSDNLNIGNTWAVFTGSVDDDDLKTLLKDGTYSASDNDEFDYEQKIIVGAPTLEHFRDSDYEVLAGLDKRTPVVGFKLSSNTFVLNYTLDFTQDAESDIVSGDMDDIEGSDLTLLGKTYYVSDLKNGTSATYLGKLTLLDTAVAGSVSEGETTTVTSGNNSYEVGINYIDSDEVRFIVDEVVIPQTGKLQNGQSYKLSDGSYVGVRDISKLEVSGETGTVTFSIGSGKLEITSASDVEVNDKTVSGFKGYVYRGTGSSGTEKIDKIVLEWRTDEEAFLTAASELVMPAFEAVKFSMNELVRTEEEKITIEKDSDTSVQMTLPIKDGIVNFNLLYSNASGDFTGIGKASDERLATSATNSLTFTEKSGGTDYHSYFVASYNISAEAESYLLRAKVKYDSTNDRNETTIEKNVNGAWETSTSELSASCPGKVNGDTCDLGLVSLNIGTIAYTSGGTESVAITAGSNVNFNTIYTAGGLKIYLPYAGSNSSTSQGIINFTKKDGQANAGHDRDSWYLYMDGEDKDDNIASGTQFSFTIDDNTDNNLHVPKVNTTGGGGGQGSGGENGLEQGDTNIYETYVKDEVGTRILHYTQPDEDYVEVYYPSGNSETYAEVFLAETSAIIAAGTAATAGGGNVVIVKDSEMGDADKAKNLVVIGGSCINTVAAKLLGSDTPVCGDAWETETAIGAGKYLIETFTSPYASDQVAILVAGYSAADTVNAATYLKNEGAANVDTTAGKKYTGTTATSAEEYVAETTTTEETTTNATE